MEGTKNFSCASGRFTHAVKAISPYLTGSYSVPQYFILQLLDDLYSLNCIIVVLIS